MHTHYVADVDLDEKRLNSDLARSDELQWSEAYSDYIFGGSWRSCMLWAKGGESGDGVVTHYDHDKSSDLTAHGAELPYLSELIREVADLSRLNFVRLAKVTNSVGVPHRDLLELTDVPDEARNAHRLHIPLVTDESCLFTESEIVFRMKKGEVWFLDASKIHSIAVMSELQRIHLIFDFIDTPEDAPYVKLPGATPSEGIPDTSVVNRPALTEADRRGIASLASNFNRDTFHEVFSIVMKKHYRFDGGETFAWDAMEEIARGTGDQDLVDYTRDQRRHFTLERAA